MRGGYYDPEDDIPVRQREYRESERKREAEERAGALFDVYGIKPSMSLKARTSLLYDRFDQKEVEEIAETLNLLEDDEARDKIRGYIVKIEESIDANGREKTDREKQRYKGQVIRRFESTLARLQEQMEGPLDATKLSALTNQASKIEAKLLELHGIDRKDQPKEETIDAMGTLTAKIAELTTDRVARLREFLAVA